MSRTAQRGVIARIGGLLFTVVALLAGTVAIMSSTGTKTCKSAPAPAPAVQLAAQTAAAPESTRYVFLAQWTRFQPNEVNILYTDYLEDGHPRKQIVLDTDKGPSSWKTVITAPNGSKPTLEITPPPWACNDVHGLTKGASVSCVVYLVSTSKPEDSMIPSNVQARATNTTGQSAICKDFTAGKRKHASELDPEH
ncbi:MAG TPA: hypothetical protein VMT30_08380 [Candidatus Saccharimonadia bacterium]|nr:hypothetical protein [Candidatus Saccharimonadia bacterium]